VNTSQHSLTTVVYGIVEVWGDCYSETERLQILYSKLHRIKWSHRTLYTVRQKMHPCSFCN